MKDFRVVSKNVSREDQDYIKTMKKKEKQLRELKKNKRYCWTAE